MNMCTERITVSSDLGGMNPSFYNVRDIYQKAGFGNVGLEVVWLKNQNQYVHDLSCGFPVFDEVDGFHAQLGSVENPTNHGKGVPDWFLIQVADSLMPSEAKKRFVIRDMINPLEVLPPLLRIDLVGSVLNRDIYLNVHDDIVTNYYSQYRDHVSSFSAFSHLSIEGGPGRGAVERTNSLVERLRDDTGKRVVGTFDIVHAIVGLLDGAIPDLESTMSVWSTVLTMIDLDIYKHLHFPIGTKIDDSLPILKMIENAPTMLADLASAMGDMSITIENQHNLIVGLWPWEVKGEVGRLKRIREAMQKSGMIDG